MIVKNINKRFKQNIAVSIAVIIAAVLIAIFSLSKSYKILNDSKKRIYVIDNGIPVLLQQTDMSINRGVEYRSQIELFHRLFFTLVPDDEFIKNNIEKALYLIDQSGKKEYSNLQEKGFYNQVISSNASLSIKTDSVVINGNEFNYYGRQVINREKNIIVRKLNTKGSFEDVVRSENNPHGVLLKNWIVIDNSEISNRRKHVY